MRLFFTLIFSLTVMTAAIAGPGGIVKEDPFLKEFSVYPNPTNGILMVSLNTIETNTTVQLKVYNLLGKEMKALTISPFSGVKNLRLNLDNLPKGIYMIEISNGTQSKTKRVSLI